MVAGWWLRQVPVAVALAAVMAISCRLLRQMKCGPTIANHKAVKPNNKQIPLNSLQAMFHLLSVAVFRVHINLREGGRVVQFSIFMSITSKASKDAGELMRKMQYAPVSASLASVCWSELERPSTPSLHGSLGIGPRSSSINNLWTFWAQILPVD